MRPDVKIRVALALVCMSFAVQVASTGDHHATEDDFAFETAEHTNVPIRSGPEKLRRLWGVPDILAYVGKLFTFHIPEEAFSGKVTSFKVHSASGGAVPSWLLVDGKRGFLRGVPGPHDVGSHALHVTAIGEDKQYRAADDFTIDVKGSQEGTFVGLTNNEDQCISGDDELLLVILCDAQFNTIKPKHRIRILTEIANFMGLNADAFTLLPYKQIDNGKKHFTVLYSGPGHKKQNHAEGSTALSLKVGCGGHLWHKHKLIVHQLREQTRDGTISELIHLPVTGWRVLQKMPARVRRQTQEGSAYDEDDARDDEDYSGYDDDNDDYDTQEYPISEVPNRGLQIIPQSSNETVPKVADEENEVESRRISFDTFNTHKPLIIVPVIKSTSRAAPTTTETTSSPVANSSTSASVSVKPTQSTEETFTGEENIDDIVTESIPSNADTSATTTVPSTEAVTENVASSEGSSTIFGRTTETIDFTFPVNNPPRINHRMKKVAVTAGKAFSYIIPEDVFDDIEDGTNLHLEMFNIEGTPLKTTSWVQFNATTREVYGLPLEEHVSRWEYSVEATDSAGLKVREKLDITVQQHKGRRTVNHEFAMKLRLDEKFPIAVDWQILVLRGLVNLFRDTDMDQITVRNVDLSADPVEFVWTNDTLPKNVCPQTDIDRLLGILQSGLDGTPSNGLVSALSPSIRVKWVGWRAAGPCQEAPSPAVPPVVLPANPDNFSPVPRNQIDHIDATVGQLLVYQVPEDSFYDPEEGSVRNLKVWLVRGDRSAVPTDHWLQFDSKNQEFYGLPTERDIGRKDYQLNCEDSGGLTAHDSLVVVVHPRENVKPALEIVMSFDRAANPLANSPTNKRKFVEKLATLLRDKNTSSIHISDISENPTTVTWYNTSLSSEKCPNTEIKEIRKILVNDDDSLTERVDTVMGAEFPLMSIQLQPSGICLGAPTVIHSPEIVAPPPNVAEDNAKSATADDYLITFIIPAIVIVFMILIAGIVACVLYRRRQTGKMSIGDDEERQEFRPKGIPVIFQDELDEKPDPSNKSPVIMKEEKPPLLPPPEYKGSDNSPAPSQRQPYHPPPPFATSRDSARNSRPKATPTYRKPPPYVPP